MKPQSPINRQRRTHPKHPNLDVRYRATEGGFRAAGAQLGRSKPLSSPSFRSLSDQFLGAEMKRDYAVEAALFAIIVAVAAWPIGSLIQAVASLAK